MKTRITQKEVKNTHIHVIKVGYCQLQHLLTFKDPYAYTCGGDGWHSDVYSIGTVAISTGYQPFGSKVDYETIKKYDDTAALILGNTKLRYEDKEFMLTSLLHEFIEEVTA